MANSQQASVTFTIVAQGSIAKGRGVAWNGTQANDGAGAAGVPIMGIADHAVTAGEALRVIFAVTAMAESGAAIDGVENRLKTDAQGRMIPWTAGSIVAARLVPGQTAATAGEYVEVVPLRVS